MRMKTSSRRRSRRSSVRQLLPWLQSCPSRLHWLSRPSPARHSSSDQQQAQHATLSTWAWLQQQQVLQVAWLLQALRAGGT